MAVYDLEGRLLQEISPDNPGEVRYNNVDLVYGFQLGDETVDLAVASDRENDTLAIWEIDPETRQLTNITANNLANANYSIFGEDDGEQTAYGLATYTSVENGKTYVYVSQADANQISQLELIDSGSGRVTAEEVRRLSLPIPEGGELDDAQIEGMVVDRELGILYAGQEEVGIWKFDAEVDGNTEPTLIDEVGDVIQADVEGLTVYYGGNGTGYLLVSSQGNSTFAVYDRQNDNEFIGNFFIGESGDIDGAEESDGADVINVPVGDFSSGLLVVQDGGNEPELVQQDPEDGEIQNFNTNFKFVPWENVANSFPTPLEIDTESFDPRNLPEITDTLDGDELDGGSGNEVLRGGQGRDRLNGLGGNDTLAGGSGGDELIGGSGNDSLYGQDGNDTLEGRRGSDRLFGGAGNDVLRGGQGRDWMNGCAGDDTLIGGASRDRFSTPTPNITEGIWV